MELSAIHTKRLLTHTCAMYKNAVVYVTTMSHLFSIQNIHPKSITATKQSRKGDDGKREWKKNEYEKKSLTLKIRLYLTFLI